MPAGCSKPRKAVRMKPPEANSAEVETTRCERKTLVENETLEWWAEPTRLEGRGG
jgi:hypothetical protein